MTAAGSATSGAESANLRTALRLAAARLPIFPVTVNYNAMNGTWEKRPVIKGWQDRATSDEAEIRRLWVGRPDAVPGIELGRAGLVVIDADRHGGPDGVKALQVLCTDLRLPPHPVTLTAGRGEHHYFGQPEGEPLGNGRGDLPKGIDVRGRGGWIVGPGSIRRDSNGWVSAPGAPDLAEAFVAGCIPPIPESLVKLIRATRFRANGAERPSSDKAAGKDPFGHHGATGDARSTAYAHKALEENAAELAAMPPHSGRNNALNAIAYRMGRMIGAGWIGSAEVWEALWRACETNDLLGEDGPARVRATLESGLGAGEENPHPGLGEREQPCDGSHGGAEDQAPPRDEAGSSASDEKTGGKEGGPKIIAATPFAWIDPVSIPPRRFIYDGHYIRQFVSLTVAPGGVGKSSLGIVEALSVASGKSLLGVTPAERARVWLWNGEDPLEELQRRIMAAVKHYGLTHEDFEGWLFVDSGRRMPIVIAEQTRNGTTIAAPVVEAVIATIEENDLDVIIVDPFVSSHRVTENDNNAIERVAKTWGSIADATNSAIELVHHARKTNGAEVSVEDGRGAVALLAAARSARVLNTMTEDEAAKAGIENRRLYFRSDNGKSNLAPPPEGSSWFRLESVDLGNGVATTPFDFSSCGDKVGVVTAWKWPDALEGVTVGDLRAAQKAVSEGGPWRENSQAGDWVGKPIAKALGLNIENKAEKRKVQALLKIWIEKGMFVVVAGQDALRRPKAFVEVGKWAGD